LMEKNPFFENISELKENLRLYLETKLSYYGLTAFEKAVKILTVITGNGFILLVMWMALIFFSGAVAFYIGTLLDSNVLGLLIISGAYFLLGIILIIFRNRIFSSIIIKLLLNVFFKDDDEEESFKK
jgi:hypothetical protein